MKDNRNKSIKTARAGSFAAKKIAWSIVFVVIAGMTVWAVVSQSRGLSFRDFIGCIRAAHPLWLGAAFASMAAYIIFEAAALLALCRAFGYKKRFRDGFIYCSADLYFSAITPSATGGQPACAYFMHADGITVTHSATIMVVFILLHTCSTVFTGLLASALAPLTITRFSALPRAFVAVGFIIQIVLLSILVLITLKEKIILRAGGALIKFFGKIKLIKDPDGKLERLGRSTGEYREKIFSLCGRPGVLVKVLIYCILNRIAPILATVFTYLALGNPANFLKAFSLQTYISIGAFCIPIPCSMGITE